MVGLVSWRLRRASCARRCTAGPVASQEVIKELGTNGGGFFNVNSAHPFENPTWLSNFVELLLILAIPAALTSVYGRMVGNRRQGWAIYAAMLSLLVVAVIVVCDRRERPATPAMDAAGVAGFNMEGKEQRFGIASTALWVVGHHGRLVRRRQRRDGVAHGHRRHGPDGRDADRRGRSSAASAPGLYGDADVRPSSASSCPA